MGAGAVKELDPQTCELKSVYLLQRCQGRGLGSKVVDEAIRFTRESGYQTMLLGAIKTSEAAIRVYRKRGFVETGRYNENGYADLFMRLDLK